MTIADIDWLAVALRTAVYIGAIAAAGGVLFLASVERQATVSWAVARQVRIGALLLIVVEPLRYVHFQLAISGGDPALAFDPSMRWMAIETPIGQASGVRLAAALVLLLGGRRFWPVSLAAALAMIGSFALEGHTAAHEDSRPLAAALLLAHLTSAHWWLGALYPLRAATLRGDPTHVARLVERFGRIAIAIVIVLALAGTVLMALLSGWEFDIGRSHHVMFVAKIAVFSAILAIAAANKLRWTPLLSKEPDRGSSGLRKSLNIELSLCAAILLVTAVMTSFSPNHVSQ